MSLTVLDKIKAYKLIEIENDKKIKPLSDIEALAKNAPVVRPFAKALANSKKNSHSLIAEIKKASPSKGLIRKILIQVKLQKHMSLVAQHAFQF